MLDPRVYRTSLVLAALALVVLAFSLGGRPSARRTSLAPTVFNAENVTQTLDRIVRRWPERAPGSTGDDRLAAAVAHALGSRTDGFAVRTAAFPADTTRGTRILRNVVATRAGTDPEAGSVVVVAGRDAAGAPARAAASGTATLLELGRDLGGETLRRTIVLASVSGTAGAAGTTRLVSELRASGPVDAVLVLGDLASRVRHQPTVVPWSTGAEIAPLDLRQTVSAALTDEGAGGSSSPGIPAQLAHLAFPLTVSAQGPFGAAGFPAVEVSFSGERGPAADAPVAGTSGLGAAGRAVLSAVSALSAAPAVAAPSAYVVFDGEVVPRWAMALFVLGLILPVALTALDGVARARRRRQLGVRSLLAVLAAAGPFLAALVVVLVGGAAGAFPTTPAPVGPGTTGVSGSAVTVLVVAGVLAGLGAVAAGLLWRRALAPAPVGRASRPRPGGARAAGSRRELTAERPGDGLAAATLLVLCVVALLVWFADPFAAALLVPALHLWLWAVDSDLRLPAPVRVVMVLLGAVPTAALVVFYAHSLGFSPTGLVWEATLLTAGHDVSAVAAVEWCLALGCAVSALVVIIAAALAPKPVAAPVTVRGPVTYAGPGSLGGTRSALRR